MHFCWPQLLTSFSLDGYKDGPDVFLKRKKIVHLSKYCWTSIFLGNQQPKWYQCFNFFTELENSFSFLGCIWKKILMDSLKSFLITYNISFEPENLGNFFQNCILLTSQSRYDYVVLMKKVCSSNSSSKQSFNQD